MVKISKEGKKGGRRKCFKKEKMGEERGLWPLPTFVLSTFIFPFQINTKLAFINAIKGNTNYFCFDF